MKHNLSAIIFKNCTIWSHCWTGKNRSYINYWTNRDQKIELDLTLKAEVPVGTAIAQSWSSLIAGDEACIGPSGKLFCLWQTQKVCGTKVIYTKVERLSACFSCLHAQCGLLRAARWRRWMKNPPSPAWHHWMNAAHAMATFHTCVALGLIWLLISFYWRAP